MIARRSFLLLFGLAPLPFLRGQALAMPDLEELFPSDNVFVDVMALQLPAKAEELSARISEAVAADQTWFAAYLKEHGREYPLPYDPKLGITEAEYRNYLALRKEGTLEKTGESLVKVRRTSSRVVMRIEELRNSILPIAVDFASQTLTTPLFSVTQPVAHDSGAAGGLIGPNQSYTWHGQTGDPEHGTWSSLTFTIGRLTDGDRKFIDYQVKKFVAGRPEIQSETIWFF